MKTLRCPKHGVECTFNPATNERKFALTRGRGGGTIVCGLMLAQTPAAGRLVIHDPDTGRATALFCDVEEMG